MGKFKIILLLVFFFIASYFVYKYNKKPIINKYLFIQQIEDTCHICSWFNYNILQTLRKQNQIFDIKNIQKLKGMSKYNCYAIDSKLALSWHHHVVTMSNNNEISKKYPNITEFFNNCFHNGIIIPHIYIDKECTTNIFNHYGLMGLSLFYFIPGTCSNYNDIQKININFFGFKRSLENIMEFPTSDLSFPYYITNKNKKFIYNLKKKQFEPYTNVKQIANYYKIPINKIKYLSKVKKNKILCDVYLINIQKLNTIYLYLPIKTTNKKEYAWQIINNDKGIGLEYCNQYFKKDRIIIYGTNVLHLLLLILGVDTKNNDITKTHPMYKYMMEFRKSLEENSSFQLNMWNKKDNPYLLKENLFQYHLTNILKEDNLLFQNLEFLLNDLPIPIWKIYNNIGNYYNVKGKKINNTKYKDYMLGKHQMMAYIISVVIWLSWKGAISIEAFSDALQIPYVIGYFLWYKFLYAINYKNMNGISMMNVFDIISKKINKLKVKEFTSIASHGYVVSYEQDLINLQINSAKSVNNKKLLYKLPAIIDSWNADKMKNVFYVS